MKLRSIRTKPIRKRLKRLAKTLRREVHLPIPLPKNKVGALLGKQRKIFFADYLINSWRELNKVAWPNRRESFKLTWAVILFSLFFVIITAIADAGFAWVVERVFL